MNLPPDVWPAERVRAWTTALDALAAAGGAAVAATAERDLLAATADALAVAELSVHGCPMIVSAMEQRTPLVQASMADPAELGILPDGRRVADAFGAGSYAVSPIMADESAIGAITIVRGKSQPHVTFLELNVLAHIADLAAAAIERLSGPASHPGPRRQDLRDAP